MLKFKWFSVKYVSDTIKKLDPDKANNMTK